MFYVFRHKFANGLVIVGTMQIKEILTLTGGEEGTVVISKHATYRAARRRYHSEIYYEPMLVTERGGSVTLYPSVRAASEATGVRGSAINHHLDGRLKYWRPRGYKFDHYPREYLS